jgi:hypothetical protein
MSTISEHYSLPTRGPASTSGPVIGHPRPGRTGQRPGVTPVMGPATPAPGAAGNSDAVQEAAPPHKLSPVTGRLRPRFLFRKG